jgi:tRNA G10  N-methylase Trm11
LFEQLFVTLPYALEREPPPFEGNDIKYPESLVRYFLKRFTKRGDKVFDPFAGLGTTLFVAEEMHRIPFGVERDERRHRWVAGQLEHWRNLRLGDSSKLASHAFQKMDFAMTSPPYMPRHHKWNPLCGGDPAHAGYEAYLQGIERIFRQLARLMKHGGIVVVHADNLPGRTYTPLVRDLSLAIGKVLRLEAEIVVAWKGGPKSAPLTHCLVFKAV